MIATLPVQAAAMLLQVVDPRVVSRAALEWLADDRSVSGRMRSKFSVGVKDHGDGFLQIRVRFFQRRTAFYYPFDLAPPPKSGEPLAGLRAWTKSSMRSSILGRFRPLRSLRCRRRVVPRSLSWRCDSLAWLWSQDPKVESTD